MNLSQIDLNRLTHHLVDGFLLLLVCIFCTADQLLVEICVVLYVTHLSIVFQSHLSFPPLGVHSMSKFHSWGPKDVVYKIFIPIIYQEMLLGDFQGGKVVMTLISSFSQSVKVVTRSNLIPDPEAVRRCPNSYPRGFLSLQAIDRCITSPQTLTCMYVITVKPNVCVSL